MGGSSPYSWHGAPLGHRLVCRLRPELADKPLGMVSCSHDVVT